MFTHYAFVNQDIKFAGVQRFIDPQNQQFPAAGNDRRMALKGSVGQSAKGTLCFAQAAGFHLEPKIDCIWTAVLHCCQPELDDWVEEIKVGLAKLGLHSVQIL
jgi:hypothetical protein